MDSWTFGEVVSLGIDEKVKAVLAGEEVGREASASTLENVTFRTGRSQASSSSTSTQR